MTGLVLPAAARAALAAKAPSAELVARPGSRLHLHSGSRPSLGDFTRSGALHLRHRPVCGRKSRRWYLAEPDGRALCGSCAAWACRHLDLTAPPVSVEQLVDALNHATCAAEVDAVQSIALARGLTSTCVPYGVPRRDIALHRAIALARSRVTPARVGAVERSWLQRMNASRFPRRIA